MKEFAKKAMKQCLSVLLIIIFVFCTLPHTSVLASGGDLPFSDALDKLADPDTGSLIDHLSTSTLENGRIWTDKTVSADSAVIYDLAGKPVSAVEAAADEFLITLSALSQSYTVDTVVEPTDTVFILDVSASMYINKLNNGKSRVEVMVDALNDAIGMLMDSNPANRIAVVAFGGDSGEPRIVEILELGRYRAGGDKFFSMESAAYIKVNCQSADAATSAPLVGRIRVFGGTPTQLGIYVGATILMKNSDTDYTYYENGAPVTVARKPNIVLLSDGGATFGWTDYTFGGMTSGVGIAHDHGDANNTDIGIDILTVLTAAYCKKQVSDHYYGAGDAAKAAGFYTIGLGVNTSVNALSVLDPGSNAQNNNRTFSGKSYNMKAVLDGFLATGGTGVSFPALNYGSASARSLVSAQNIGHYLTSFDYTDGFYNAVGAEDLTDAFESIARRIISTGSYSTKVGAGGADFDGYLIFSDVLGEYMEFKGSKGLWFDNKKYDGHLFAQSMISDPLYRDKFITALCEHQDYFGYDPDIPAQLAQAKVIATSLLDSCIAAGKSKGGLYYNSQTDFSNKIKYYADENRRFVANYFDSSANAAAPPAGAKCVVDLYTMEGTVRDPVTGEDTDIMGIAIHVVTAIEDGDFQCVYSDGSELVRHLKRGQQVVRWYIPASLIPTRTVTQRDGGVQVRESLPIRFIYAAGLRSGLNLPEVDAAYKALNKVPGKDAYYFYTNDWRDNQNFSMAFFRPNDSNPYYSGTYSGNIPKTQNLTNTKQYVVNESAVTVNGERVQVQHLGNNGRLTVPFTEISVTKDWYLLYSASGLIKDEYVQLYANDVPVGAPVLMDSSGLYDEYTWEELFLYDLTPDTNGRVSFIEYTFAEGTVTGGIFTPYDLGANAPGFAIFYRQPEWNENGGYWEDAYIVNYEIQDSWYLTIEKIVEGDVPAWGAGTQIVFEILDNSNTLIPGGTKVYPGDFTAGKCHIEIPGSGTYIVREINGGAVAGYGCVVSIGSDHSGSVYTSGDGYIELDNVQAGRTVTVTFTNAYTDLNVAGLTLKKAFSGVAPRDYPDDVAFEIVGFGGGDVIYQNTVYYHDFTDPGTGLQYAMERLLPGTYTVTEFGGEVAGYGKALSAEVDGIPAGLSADSAVTVTLSAGDDKTVEFDNQYVGRSLIIQKEIRDLNKSEHPDDIEFHIVGFGGGNVIYERHNISYSAQFDSDGKYELPDIVSGYYTVTETGGEVGGYTMTVSVTNGGTASLGTGDSTITFINTYTPSSGSPDGGSGGNRVYDMKVEKELAKGQPSIVSAGADVHYVIRVTNTGNAALTDIKVTDLIERGEYELGLISGLAPNESKEFTFTYCVSDSAQPGTVMRNTAVAEQSHVGKREGHVDVTVSMFSDDHIWYIRGYEDGTIRPDKPVTRAEAAVVFYRLLHGDIKNIAPSSKFTDVTGKEWYGAAVNLLAHYGILSGYSDGSFKPNQFVTRSELAAIISRFGQLIETSENPFTDLDSGNWAYKYILSAAKNGWFIGDSGGRFRPGDNITRSEFVTAVNRVLIRRIALEDIPGDVHKFGDLDRSHWAYAAFIEAVYTHDFVRKADGADESWVKITDDGLYAPYNR